MQLRAKHIGKATLVVAACSMAALLAFGCSSGDSAPTVANSNGAANGTDAGTAGTGSSIGPLGGGTHNGGAAGGMVKMRTEPTGPKFLYTTCAGETAYKGTSVDASACSKFAGATPAVDPKLSILYPLDGAMLPPNLPTIKLMWTQGDPSNGVFLAEVVAQGTKYHFYTTCNSGNCELDMPSTEWRWLGWKYPGVELTLTVQGMPTAGGTITASAPVKITFAPEDVQGAMYYWAASTGTIKRVAIGADSAVPFITPSKPGVTSPTNSFGCSACHSVSRDGMVIAFAVTKGEEGKEDNSAIQVAPTTDPTKPFLKPALGTSAYDGTTPDSPSDPAQLGQISALNKDGSLIAVSGAKNDSDPVYFEIREAQTGKVLDRHNIEDGFFGANQIPLFPEWSPSGADIAVAMGDSTGDTTAFGCVWPSETCRSSIWIMSYNASLKKMGKGTVLVPHKDNYYHYYPTWSEDGKWVAFVTSQFDPAKMRADNPSEVQKSESNPNGVLNIVPSTGGPYDCPGPKCIQLSRGMVATGKQATWPKFTPFMIGQGTARNIMFLSFTSKMNYGFKGGVENQLWMMAVDADKLTAGQDGSFAPFWLPYQDLEESNLTPFWSEVLPCETDSSGGCKGCVTGVEECQVNTATNACSCRSLYKVY